LNTIPTIKKAAVLLTVHNRKQKTLKCLADLHVAMQRLHEATVFDIYLTDDGSSDGTWEAVAAAFPDVCLISGDGNLYWGRGMRKAWEHAVATGDYDGFFWLNNDSCLYPDALVIMYETIRAVGEPAVISGAFVSETTGQVTYGGKINDRVLTPNGQPEKFCQLNGNFVFVPKQIVETIGLLDPVFHHALGDYDYGYRALKAGFCLYLTPCYTGVCERDSQYHRYRDARCTVAERFRFFYSPLSPVSFGLFRFNARHFSLFKAICVFLYLNMVCLCPGIRKLAGKA
jgi:GT2 family glycosyltransferase